MHAVCAILVSKVVVFNFFALEKLDEYVEIHGIDVSFAAFW